MPFNEIESELSNILENTVTEIKEDEDEIIQNLKQERSYLIRKKRRLQRYKYEYSTYLKNLKSDHENIKPVKILKSKFSDVLQTSITSKFIELLEIQLTDIKNALKDIKPIGGNVERELKSINSGISVIDAKLNSISDKKEKDLVVGKEKYMFIGELKTKLQMYQNAEIDLDPTLIQTYQEELNTIKKEIKGYEESRDIVLGLFHEELENFKKNCDALGNYQDYKTIFSSKEKVLKMRKPNSLKPESTIGSKSNYMFLHLILFLGLHSHAIKRKIKFIPSFLILDQISLPYYNDSKNIGLENIKSDDEIKLLKAFKLLDYFYSNLTENKLDPEFQIILLEHAGEKYWENLKNFNLVEEFRGGNALVKPENIAD